MLVSKIVIFASGSGTNAFNLMEYAAANSSKVKVLALISDKDGIGAIEFAKKFSVPNFVIPHKNEEALLKKLNELKPDWAFLAGYMRVVRKSVIQFFWDEKNKLARILNIHPSLLPRFPGLHAYEQAWKAGVSSSGITVHFVDEGVDTGKILIQESFDRSNNDTFETFEKKGRAIEKKIFVQALDLVANRKVLTDV